ncbi:MAG: hypothetical protein ACMUJM_01895 [bacterium]
MKETIEKVGLSFLVLMIMTAAFIKPASGDTGDIVLEPSFEYQTQVLPVQSMTTGDILVDNFEYFDSPYNHGWRQLTPPYPVYGFGIGYSVSFETILDLDEGSRVLNAYRPASEFILGTEYEKYFITKYLVTPSTASYPNGAQGIYLNQDIPDSAPIVSIKFRSPLSIEQWDMFEFHVHGTTLGNDGIVDTDDDMPFLIKILPLEPLWDADIKRGSTLSMMWGYEATLIQEGSSASSMIIQVNIGRNFNSGTWHTIWLDLRQINEQAHSGSIPAGQQLGKATHIMAGGTMFRMDDIIFRKKDFTRIQPPDLIEIGPRYAQLYESLRFLFMAAYQSEGKIARMTDLLLDSHNFLTEPAAIAEAWLEDSKVNGVIQMDPNYLDPGHPLYGTPNPYYSQLLGREFIIDINLPVFADPELRIIGETAVSLRDKVLEWRSSVGGYAHKGTPMQAVRPLPINPYDGMPTYIPLYYYSGFMAVHSQTRFSTPSFGLAHYGPLECRILESAMYNAGFTRWPNIAYMDYTPQVIENLIVTIEVTNGLTSDVETFPLTVVNYPVENYPPAVQLRICPRVFYIGEQNQCSIWFSDPDCLIFSLAQFFGGTPATNHLPALPGNEIRNDQDQFIYTMTIDGLPSYQYGPWQEVIIDPYSGLIDFDPMFEGMYHTIVTVKDNYGAAGVGQRMLMAVNRGTWLNHPPMMTRVPTRPQLVRAGEELILGPPQIQIFEPDGEQLYATCNIGAAGKSTNGAFIWSFQTSFPGIYNVELFFYDDRGGYMTVKFPVEVTPWWTD